MADFRLFVRAQNEAMAAFNRRLREGCSQSPITSYEVAIVDGVPVVALLSELVEATEEDVAEGKEVGEDIKLGEPIPNGDTILVQIAGISTIGDNAAASEVAMDKLNTRCNGDALGIKFFTGDLVQFVLDRNECDANGTPLNPQKPKFLPVTTPITYAAVVSLFGGDEEDDGKAKAK